MTALWFFGSFTVVCCGWAFLAGAISRGLQQRRQRRVRQW